MTYQTHKQYAISFAFLTAMLMYKYNMTEINYYLALPILILTAKYGGLLPDVDHSWHSVKEKTVPNWIINKLIHITGGKHRSWQTHSIDIVIIITLIAYLLPEVLYSKGIISIVNKEILALLSLGVCSGWISHILADMMTSGGVRLVCWRKKSTVRLVPRHIGKLKFNTGNEWEEFVFKVVRIINIGLGVFSLIYPFILNGTIATIFSYIADTI